MVEETVPRGALYFVVFVPIHYCLNEHREIPLRKVDVGDTRVYQKVLSFFPGINILCTNTELIDVQIPCIGDGLEHFERMPLFQALFIPATELDT